MPDTFVAGQDNPIAGLPFSKYLDLNGDGSGVKNLNQDYSAVAGIAYTQPVPGTVCNIARLLITVYDTQVMQAQEYGNLGVALANGITVRVQDDNGTLINLTDNVPIKTNGNWAQLCHDAKVLTWGAGNEYLTVRWSFFTSGEYVQLVGNENQRLEVLLNDNFTGLLSHYFLVQGHTI